MRRQQRTTPRVFGMCCVCGFPCIAGQRITAAAKDCLVRHTECLPDQKDRRVSESK